MHRSKLWIALPLLLLSLSAFQRPAWADDEDAPAAEGAEDDEYADAEKAHLVVRKFIKDAIPVPTSENGALSGLIVQGRNVTVVIDIYNAGVSAAHNVVLKDTLPENATLVDGSLTADLGRITTGAHVKHSYTVVFQSGGTFATLPLAVVSYSPEADSATTQDSYSSLYGFFIMTPVQQIQRYALKVGSYASLGFAKSATDWRNLAIVFGVVGTVLGVNWSVKRFKAAGVNRRREKALKALEKQE